MTDQIEDRIRQIVREEIQAAIVEQRWPSHSVQTIVIPGVESMVEPHYSVAKVADLLDVSTDWVYRRIREGVFSVVELGGNERSNQRIAASELTRWIKSRSY